MFGDYNPGGKLSQTWYKSDDDLLNIEDYNLREGIGRTYEYFKGTPLYPFGYGLSYTTFEYSNMKIDNTNVTPDSTVNVSVDVKNTGIVAGDEIVQLYAHEQADIKSKFHHLKLKINALGNSTLRRTLYNKCTIEDKNRGKWVG